MIDPTSATDASVLAQLGSNLARHRAQRALTQAELATQAGVSLRTVIRIEAGASTQLTNLVRVLRALGLLANLQQLAPPLPPSPFEQLAAAKRERKRVRRSSRRALPAPGSGWQWGDREGRS